MKRLSIVTLFLSLAAHHGAAQTGLLVVAHGADSNWNAQVRRTVSQVRWAAGPVTVAFVMGPEAEVASFDAGGRDLVAKGARRIVVVPLMVSSFGSHTYDIQSAASHGTQASMMHGTMHGAMADDSGGAGGVPMRTTSALDASPELGEALAAQWNRLSAGDRQRPLVLVAHGPNDDADALQWIANITAATRPLAERLPDRSVHIGLLRDDAPAAVRAAAVTAIRDTIVALSRRRNDSVMVMTVLISSGTINSTVVPHDLAGMPMHYLGASLAPDPALARWIERVAGAVSW